MVNLEVQRLLNQVILDYMSRRGLHQTRETFRRELFANLNNIDAVNSSQEAFLQLWWNKFYEAYTSNFLDFPIVDDESLDKENVVANNISNVMSAILSPHLVESSHVMESSDTQITEPELLELLEKYPSISQFPDQLNERDILPFTSNARLDQVILDYMSKRGLHQTREIFRREIFANQNNDAANSSQQAFLQLWWDKFYEAYTSKFLDFPIVDAESLDKKNVVANNTSNVMSAILSRHLVESSHVMESIVDVESLDKKNVVANNTSNVMSAIWSPHLVESSHVMESIINVESFDKENVVANNTSNVMPAILSPHFVESSHVPESSDTQITEPELLELLEKYPLISQFPDQLNERDILPFASNAGYGINLEGSTLMEPNMHAPSNALPTSPEFLDTGNNRSLQQASQDILPDGTAEYYANKLKLSLGNFLNKRTQGELRGKNARVLADTNQTTSRNLLADQPMIAPSGRIPRSYEKHLVVKSGKKRKTPLNSFTLVEKEKAIGAQQKGISIKESQYSRKTNIKLLCCHLNTQAEFLATAGHDRKVLIWELGNNNITSIDGHIQDITDVRFRPKSTVFATSSLDKTVKIWDAAEPNKTYRNLAGHDGQVMSIDYHPTMNLLSSCDKNNEIRLWDVNTHDCKLILRGGSRHVRFQPQLGNLLASSTNNIINIFDIKTTSIQKQLQGHVKNVCSICWDASGNYLASVSEDSARIWSINEGRCIFELFSRENKFQSCIFHPQHCLMLVIGSNKLLEYWNPILRGNKTASHSAHDGIISSLAVSPAKNIIASVGYDQWIKIWS